MFNIIYINSLNIYEDKIKNIYIVKVRVFK